MVDPSNVSQLQHEGFRDCWQGDTISEDIFGDDIIKKGKNISFFIIDMGIAKYNKNILNNAIIYNKYIVEGFLEKKPDENKKLYIALAKIVNNGAIDVIS